MALLVFATLLVANVVAWRLYLNKKGRPARRDGTSVFIAGIWIDGRQFSYPYARVELTEHALRIEPRRRAGFRNVDLLRADRFELSTRDYLLTKGLRVRGVPQGEFTLWPANWSAFCDEWLAAGWPEPPSR